MNKGRLSKRYYVGYKAKVMDTDFEEWEVVEAASLSEARHKATKKAADYCAEDDGTIFSVEVVAEIPSVFALKDIVNEKGYGITVEQAQEAWDTFEGFIKQIGLEALVSGSTEV